MGWIQGLSLYGRKPYISGDDEVGGVPNTVGESPCTMRRKIKKDKLGLPFLLSGVDTRTRTLDNQIHNLALYQLNYIHHTGVLGGIRTLDPRLRRAMLYPTELQTQILERAMGIGPT